jgi:thiamine kinase-like enzyme
VHRDFQYNQVLLGSDRVTIIDFDSMSIADPALDVGEFLAHLKWKALQRGWSEEEVRRFAETFVNAYQPDRPPELMQRIDFHYRAYLLRIACRAALWPQWQHLTASLLHEALAGYEVSKA